MTRSHLLSHGSCVSTASWQCARQQTRQYHLEQLHRFRFRHRPLEYLASLEKRWEQTIRTGVLPP